MKYFKITLLLLLLSLKSYATLDRDQFETITNEILNEFQEDMLKMDLRFSLNKQWNSEGRIASIKIPNGEATLSISGFMARQELMTEDAFRLLLCHEVGHVLGGAPKQSPGHWSSSEGQADYYSTSKCIKRILPNDDNLHQRIRKASLALAQLDALGNGNHPEAVSLDNKDKTIVLNSISTHPNSQCRLDTLIAGLNCKVDPYLDFDRTDSNIGACTRKNADNSISKAARPRCWFRPPSKRLYCTSQEKFTDYGGSISQLTLLLDNERDNGTINVTLSTAISNPALLPLTIGTKDGQEIEHKDYSITQENKMSFKVRVHKNFVNELKQYALVPIKWDEVNWNEDGDNYLFNTSCIEQ